MVASKLNSTRISYVLGSDKFSHSSTDTDLPVSRTFALRLPIKQEISMWNIEKIYAKNTLKVYSRTPRLKDDTELIFIYYFLI